jgi:NhaA family Na+:H+ antiporter
MIVPAAIYAAFNVGGSGQAGWGIPMATDIAFALGVLALLGDRIPVGLKVFLTALAIVDDIGAVLVIAVFYTDAVSFVSLGTGAALYALAILLRFLQMRSSVVYFIVGTAVWLAFLKSGVHATIAALLMAFIIPSTTRIDGAALLGRLDEYIRRIRRAGVPGDRRMNTAEQQHVLDEMVVDIVHASSPLLRLEHALVPVAAFLVLPIFALANAGVSVGAGELLVALTDPIALGTIVGLFVGKQVGVALFTWVAVKAGLADLPANVSWRQVYGVATLAGVGFTMSLFISGLAFTEALNDIAKVGILAGSILSGLVGWMILRPAGRGAGGLTQRHGQCLRLPRIVLPFRV